MKPTATRRWRLALALLSSLHILTGAVSAQLRVAVMPNFNQNQTYGNAALNKPVAVWGRAWGGVPPYTYELDRGDGTSVPAGTPVADPKFIGGDHTYTSAGAKTMTLTVTDSVGSSVSRSARVQVFLNPGKDVLGNIAIDRGLLWLYRNHVLQGEQAYWNLSQNNSAEFQLGNVAFCVLAFEENGHKRGNDYEEDIYAELVQRGLNRILQWASARTTHGSGNFFDHSDGLAMRNMDYLNGNGFGAYLWGVVTRPM